MGVWSWISDNWFSLLQSGGIIASVLFTALVVRRDMSERRFANHILVTEQHRSIWKELYARPELGRVVDPKAKIAGHPITQHEELFLTFIILHLSTVHRAMKNGLVPRMGGVREDIRSFFTLPLPQAVWQKLKPMQDEEFVQFVEESWL